MYKKKIIVIGSGISALGFYNNSHSKNDIQIYEKNSYPGGHLKSHKIENNYFDEGAHISHSKDKDFINKFIKDIETYQIKNPIINNYKNKKKLSYPIQNSMHSYSFLEKIFTILNFIKLYVIYNFKTVYNYEDWCKLNFGDRIYKNFYLLYTLKYWRTHPKEMSLTWIAGRVISQNIIKKIKNILFQPKKKLENFSYSTFKYPKNYGFFNFFEGHFSKMPVNLNSNVTKIDLEKKFIEINDQKKIYYDKLVSSIPLKEYSKKIINLPKQYIELTNHLKYTRLLCFYIKINKKINYDDNWLYFYEQDNEISRLKILSNFDHLKNNDFYTLQAEVYRRNDEKIDIELIKKNVQKNIKIYFEIENKDFYFFSHKYIEYAYPINLLNQKKRIKKFINWLNVNDIYQIGNFGIWEFMWSDQSYNCGKNLSNKM